MTHRDHYTPEELSRIRRLRQKYSYTEIAQITGRTPGAINKVLSLFRKEGAEFPKLKHGNQKYDCKKAQEWREMIRNHMNYRKIQEITGVHPGVICRVLAEEARGELKW